jgi:hypothetical protein
MQSIVGIVMALLPAAGPPHLPAPKLPNVDTTIQRRLDFLVKTRGRVVADDFSADDARRQSNTRPDCDHRRGQRLGGLGARPEHPPGGPEGDT